MGGLCYWHKQAQLFQRGGLGGTAAHRQPVVPGSAPRGRSTAEPQLIMEEDRLSD